MNQLQSIQHQNSSARSVGMTHHSSAPAVVAEAKHTTKFKVHRTALLMHYAS